MAVLEEIHPFVDKAMAGELYRAWSAATKLLV